MASGFFALFDDIASLMDDVSTMTQTATQKTAGILGDDLAVNAEKASGFASSRELPVLWAITKGSFINKAIILPFAFLLTAFAAWSIIPILMLGGVYLAFEGAEKIYEFFVPHNKHKKVESLEIRSKAQILEEEKTKIKSAIITDLILSIEIVIIALSAVTGEPLIIQIVAVTFVAFLATIGVYGIVAMLVRMDDFGYKLIALNGGESRVGMFFVRALPKVIKSLTVIGTLAMLLVAGGIFVHNSYMIHEWVEVIPFIFGELLVGLIVGVVAVVVVKLAGALKK